MQTDFFQKLRTLASHQHARWYLFGLILVVGIFLRTYQFREWLYFYPDQARDAMIAEDVIAGRSDWPLIGPIAKSTKFRIGPIYYDFQIISGEIFGTGPDKMAYPDLFFGILSIPLFYIFLRRYWGDGRSLLLTGLYAVSFYAVHYSRFAWNPNPIPFFVLLFLLALLQFLEHEGKTKFWWALLLGIAVGVGIQLHTLLIVLFPLVFVVVGILLLRRNRRLWGHFALAIVVALVLNTAQIRYEFNHNFSNTKAFFNVSSDTTSKSGAAAWLGNAWLDVLGHAEASAQILSASGDPDQLIFPQLIEHPGRYSHQFGVVSYGAIVAGIVLSLAFFILGCYRLWTVFRREQDLRRRQFLGLLILYGGLSFLSFLPLIDAFAPRYFIQIIFVPFVFLGLLADWLFAYTARYAPRVLAVIAIVLIAGNFLYASFQAEAHAAKDRSGPQYVVLGEIEPMAAYLATQVSAGSEVSFFAEGKYVQNYFKPMEYVLRPHGLTISRIKSPVDVPPEKPIFYLAESTSGKPASPLAGYVVTAYRNFGQLAWCRLDRLR